MNNERKEYIFNWFIENYSFCWHRNGERLDSSDFTADGLEGTVLFQAMYPRGYREEDKGCISFCLYRSRMDNGPENFPLKYELSVLAADGSTLLSVEYEQTFKKGGCGWVVPKFLQIDEVLLRRKADYLPQDTLSLRCKMWKGEGTSQRVTQICARTCIGIQRISFLHVVESFSAIEPNHKKTVQIRYSTKDESVLSSSVYFTDGECCDRKIMVEITPSSIKQILSKCKFHLLDTSGNVMKCGEADNRSDATRQDIRKLPLALTWKDILNRKGVYLPGDKLSVLCECVFSSGVKLNKIEKILQEIPSVALNQIINDDPNNKSNAFEELSDYPSALDDLKGIYNNKFHTDVELKTKTKSFPAHKIVLCARSPVFKAMMSNDMREKNTDCIKIDDLDDDTTHQLLLFLYSDCLENLQWESAMKLYYAGDKYAIEKMKVLCSAFLRNNLSVSTASELLLLADTHNDYNLKKVVENFILKHEEEVFGSGEWENLIETNPQLVIKTMHLKYRKK
ncbi:Protein roadkill [Araneus ventricosus]|uniref:Protein roadkill n=1 Tax=Araneus ventricosus TaxID=182803 RepID=A0A4Y2L0P2_ARAVE|nr:Protein roadkill [Araneus ventricosus]